MKHKIQKFSSFVNERIETGLTPLESDLENIILDMDYSQAEAERYAEAYSTMGDVEEFLKMSADEQEAAIADLVMALNSSELSESRHWGPIKINGVRTVPFGEDEITFGLEYFEPEFGQPGGHMISDLIMINGVEVDLLELEEYAAEYGYSLEEFEEILIDLAVAYDEEARGEQRGMNLDMF
jgi:hypothetical protein